MPSVPIGYRSDGAPIEVTVGSRTKKLIVRAAWGLARADLGPLVAAPALEWIMIDSDSDALHTIDFRPIDGHPALATIHLRCRGLRRLDLAPLASLPRLAEFNCVFGGGDLDITPLRAHPCLARFGYGDYVVDPDVDPASITSAGVKDLIAKKRVRRRGVRPALLAGVRWTFGGSYPDRASFATALAEDNEARSKRDAGWVDALAVPGRAARAVYEDLGVDEPPTGIDVVADRPEGTTNGELLWRINEALAPLVEGRDRRYFEGLDLADTPLGVPPTYLIRLGS